MNADRFLRYGQENIIRVIADNSKLPNSRWYSGSGIYRPVKLIVGNKTHIELDGVKISTISYNPARILVETIHNGGEDAEVAVEILFNGWVVAQELVNVLNWIYPTQSCGRIQRLTCTNAELF